MVASGALGPGPASTGALLRYPVLPGGALASAEIWVGTGLKQPTGLALDALGAVYVASKALMLETNTAKRAVAKMHADTVLTDFVANLADPQGIALGDDGSLYVADGKSGRLYRFQAPPAPALDALPPASKLRSIPISGTTEPRARIDIFTNDAAPFKSEYNWVSDSPAYKERVTVDGDKATLYFECDYVDVPTRKVVAVVSADQDVQRIDGRWLITNSVAATPQLTS